MYSLSQEEETTTAKKYLTEAPEWPIGGSSRRGGGAMRLRGGCRGAAPKCGELTLRRWLASRVEKQGAGIETGEARMLGPGFNVGRRRR
ncbi:unnamed protein product [Linum trigynum]|uniref:Uncharacterized protein n=1 Tax=Linum trigynum TaxID=586398 RepID=A0AAV2E9Q0_9ROSI